ncbi:hypothetical protein BP5796_04835 [Coleophoma crateriformis]|uniref:carnosine N-methyltransferase n=1 Tax=Coleophoma crateriformis TaxID=565419 RepID=A0A3D8SB58_9HELO|nr:hypothetical protein BP5796_04835 [Coleophoma crateriformis]
MAILSGGLESFGLSLNPEPKSADDWRGFATPNDLEKARSTIRQFYRDWSEEGTAERAVCFDRVISTLKEAREQSPPMNILVPGAGLGRLVFELTLNGFNVEGNEISYHQLLASSFILNICPRARAHTLYPWIHGFSNHRTRSNHLQSILIPDIHVGSAIENKVLGVSPGEMNMAAADFISLYGDEDHRSYYDAVVAVFFLDTAPNVLRYLEVIKNCLKPGGMLINFGPLLWHFENITRSQEREMTQGSQDTQQNSSHGHSVGDYGHSSTTTNEHYHGTQRCEKGLSSIRLFPPSSTNSARCRHNGPWKLRTYRRRTLAAG